ncbi:putative HTH-type transcriptional regulator YulB [Paenibacillus faecis]|uniref:DeoR/GlpR family DNA-binding transcription regulator n=1 Tax=Paenibacillus faecis TaxID=862114 RepID=UPI001AFFD2AC|nr:DeoR/GlpR family DNA-binding transcription regulator [Paenibacillus faecis]GIO84060.1 putative HTH-type transcriptional regulator YulB [Paenibacillus faecis]
MLVAERYEKIVQLVNERGSIRVTELSELCSVTEETIRRDLDRLEQAGRLKRSHGGAVSVKEAQLEVPYFEREVTRSEEKKRIAEEAVKLVRPHDRILLDASTSAWYMAKIMPDIPMTVLTNSIKVVTELSTKEKVEVISVGGRLSPRSLSFVGPLAEKSLESFHVDKLFFSCKGVHLERGISESGELQARLKQQMMGMADQKILLADSSKFGVQAFTQVADLSSVDTVISDSSLTPDIVESLGAVGLTVKRA